MYPWWRTTVLLPGNWVPSHVGSLWIARWQLEKQSKLFYSNRTHHNTKKMLTSFCTLHSSPSKDGDLFLYPPFPTLQRWWPLSVPSISHLQRWWPLSVPSIPHLQRWWPLSVLSIPHLQRWWPLSVPSMPHPPKMVSWLNSPHSLKRRKNIQTSLDCFTSNASFVQTEY